MTPSDLCALVRAGADSHPMRPGKRGLLTDALDTVLGGTEERHLVLAYLTGHESVKDVPDRMLNALWLWVKPDRVDGQTLVSGACWREALAVLAVAKVEARERQVASSQMELPIP